MLTKQYTYPLGNETICIHITQWGISDIVYINVHENEQTAVTAGKEVLANANSGTLIELKSLGERLISFTLDDNSYTFDPNRIFTPEGIKKTLTENGIYSSIAAELIVGFADVIVKYIAAYQPKLVIALHNTTGQYAIDNYLDGREYENDRGDIFINPGHDTTDFFFTTDRALFEQIKNEGYNVVLQKNDTVVDDGSLSVYYANKLPYINIETLHGHKQMQMEMIAFANNLLKKATEP